MATSGKNTDLLNGLNPDQKKAAAHDNGPALVLAGAGSGKTRVLTYRVARLLSEKNLNGSQVLMLTFTNKAAEEMKKRITGLIGDQHSLPVSGTFHSVSARILRQSGREIGIPINFTIYDEQDKLEAVKNLMKVLNLSIKNYHPNAVSHVISEIKNELMTPRQYGEIARGSFQEAVQLVYQKYQKQLDADGILDFDDLIMKTVMLFQEYPQIRDSYTNRFRYVLVDEFQDTNKAQYTLTGLLTNGLGNIFVVGDASQSIYRWRGADYKNINAFKHDYKNLKEYHLEQNYRSTQIVLDASYAVIAKNTSHPILKLWTEKKGGDKITVYEARNEMDEATFLTQTILQSGRLFSDFAVLYRTNAQSRVIEEAFLHGGIPYILIGGTRFYERKEIKDVLSYLRVLFNPNDQISKNRIEKIGKHRLENFKKLEDRLAKDTVLVKRSTLELLDLVLEKTKYPELYDANTDDGQNRLDNITELRSVATQFPILSDFLENVALVEQEYATDRKKPTDNKQSVILMTMHAAKGLEFPIVYIVGMEEGLFPHSRSLMDREALEEERRLCYVGITRASERLYLSYANRRLYFGTRTQNAVSRFIADIPAAIIDYQVSLNAARNFDREDLLI
jgi:DNA helicase-2/ATP-dependent DNA helicase PcrA